MRCAVCLCRCVIKYRCIRVVVCVRVCLCVCLFWFLIDCIRERHVEVTVNLLIGVEVLDVVIKSEIVVHRMKMGLWKDRVRMGGAITGMGERRRWVKTIEGEGLAKVCIVRCVGLVGCVVETNTIERINERVIKTTVMRVKIFEG